MVTMLYNDYQKVGIWWTKNNYDADVAFVDSNKEKDVVGYFRSSVYFF